MKNLFVSVGLVAIGVGMVQNVTAGDFLGESGPKYWTLSATLRGFYDDNYNTVGINRRSSGGFEVSPEVSIHVPMQQTDFGLRYNYGLYYYQDRQDLGSDPLDQTHQISLWLDHAFDERWKSRVADAFAIGQEPELLSSSPVSGTATPYRLNGDNLSNHGSVILSTDWSRLFSTTLTYNNGYYDYSDSGGFLSSGVVNTPTHGGASYAGLLNRVEQSVALDLNWMLQPETTFFAGYRLAWVNYNGDEPIAKVPAVGSFNGLYHSGDRDSRSHYLYVGVEQTFSPNLTASVSAGGTYTENYADPLNSDGSWSPYANLSVTYTYLQGSTVQLGFSHDISSTDQVAPDSSGKITQYAENSVVYLNVNHRLTSKLYANAVGRVQVATYNQGANSGSDTTSYGLSFNLSYQYNSNLGFDVGYNYDDVQSDIAGYGFNRNRVYLGMTASY